VELQGESDSVTKAIEEFYERLTRDSKDPDEKAQQEKLSQLFEARRPEVAPLFERRDELEASLDGLTFGAKEGYRVWIYENLGP
jgi:hypothetical protein